MPPPREDTKSLEGRDQAPTFRENLERLYDSLVGRNDRKRFLDELRRFVEQKEGEFRPQNLVTLRFSSSGTGGKHEDVEGVFAGVGLTEAYKNSCVISILSRGHQGTKTLW